MVDDLTITKAAEMLRQAARPTRIILFGSYARGSPHPDSDVDILVVMSNTPDRVAEMVRLGRVLSPLRIPVDLLVVGEEQFQYWSDTPGNVYFAARSEGKVLYEQAA